MSDDGGVHDRFECQPITLDDSYVCVWNGKDKEPCALQVHNVKGKKIVRVKKGCREWCRLLSSQCVAHRPLANLQIWKEWEVAIDEGMENLKNKKRRHETLETNENQENTTMTKWRRKKFTDHHPVMLVTMPKEPDSEETIEVNVETTKGVFGFEFLERNIQWLRDYILKDHEQKQND